MACVAQQLMGNLHIEVGVDNETSIMACVA